MKAEPSAVSGSEERLKALVLHPRPRPRGQAAVRDPEARLAEAAGLAAAIGLNVAHAEVVPVPRANPRTVLGAGRVRDFAQLVDAEGIGVAVFDGPLTGSQQRNLEKAWNTKVIDRTGLILEIFGARARTREGTLQVELAALEYQRGRLVRSWTHLERQRGGFGFLGGPGETQIEADRRHIDERIRGIRRELERTTRTRSLHRADRARVPWPVCAMVGYTNAGKSTLFNRLTGAAVFAEDMLFATLDPTMRGMELSDGRRVIMSDTVGFISDLPPQLVAAFRATLEEVVQAEVILHVRDVAHPDTGAQREDVLAVLEGLGLGSEAEGRTVEVLNKIDLLDPENRARAENAAARDPQQVALSAVTGEGCGGLLRALGALLAKGREVIDVDVPLADGRALAWLYDKGVVHARSDDEGVAHLKVGLAAADLGRFRKRKLAAE
jgi:GTP-binding protein HflX